MLVKNDLLNHWKTRLLRKRLGDGAALVALLSLWAYCEQRRAWAFTLTPLELAGVCDFGGSEVDLYRNLVELKFILPLENGAFEVNGWGAVNAALVGKWPGRKLQADEIYNPFGGIANRKPEPIAPPIPQAEGKAIGLAIGEDRIGEDRNTPKAPKGAGEPESLSLLPDPDPAEDSLSANESLAAQKKKMAEQAAALYEAYPRKKGKDDALRAFTKRLASGIPFEALLAAVQGYAVECAGKDSQFVPYPASWVNAGHFADGVDSRPSETQKKETRPGGKLLLDSSLPEPGGDWRAVLLDGYPQMAGRVPPYGELPEDVRLWIENELNNEEPEA